MANPNGNVQNLIPFKPGETGNPGGKPVAARNRIQAKFLVALADDFEQHGAAAIAACRTSTESRYLAIIASLLPKQLEPMRGPFDDWSRDELERGLEALRIQISADGMRNERP